MTDSTKELLVVRKDENGQLQLEVGDTSRLPGSDALEEWASVLRFVVERVAEKVCGGSEQLAFEVVSRVRDALGKVLVWPDGPGRSSYLKGLESAVFTCLRGVPADAIRGLDEALGKTWIARKKEGNDYSARAVADIREAIRTVPCRQTSTAEWARSDAIKLVVRSMDEASLNAVRDNLRQEIAGAEALVLGSYIEALNVVEEFISDLQFLAELEASDADDPSGGTENRV